MPKYSKFGPMGPKNLLKNFFTQSNLGTMTLFCGVLKTIVFEAKQVSKTLIPDFTLSVGQKNEIDLASSKSSLC